MSQHAQEVISSRSWMSSCASEGSRMMEAEGGCGVVGLASSVPVAGKHILRPLIQMHNRGNGKGGGIAAVGLDAAQLGVSEDVLKDSYLVQVAYLKPECRSALEEEFIDRCYSVEKRYAVETSKDPKLLKSLEVQPPEVWRYFCRVKDDVLDAFVKSSGLGKLPRRRAEDEFVYQNSFRTNHEYYASKGMSAFVMSHGRNMLVLKIVGYAEDVITYYRMEDFKAHIWIGHQRYPTKGRVWHPGGAHPFIGLDEALVHNGDFANYHTVSEYLAQRNIVPLFLTDTEVSVLLFDVLNRTYGYPLEYIIEALAPTTERDFTLLPDEKQKVYKALQRTHIHGSPDGPWFFIIGRNAHYDGRLQLMGITDTSMLRPQVFALVDGDVQIGLIASEKQAVDAALQSISEELPSVPRYADRYWNARGGSHTDGGAFVFSLHPQPEALGSLRLICTNKFGSMVTVQHSGWDRAEDYGSHEASAQVPEGRRPRRGVLHAQGTCSRVQALHAQATRAEGFGAQLALRPDGAFDQGERPGRRRVPGDTHAHDGPEVPDRPVQEEQDHREGERRGRIHTQGAAQRFGPQRLTRCCMCVRLSRTIQPLV